MTWFALGLVVGAMLTVWLMLCWLKAQNLKVMCRGRRCWIEWRDDPFRLPFDELADTTVEQEMAEWLGQDVDE